MYDAHILPACLFHRTVKPLLDERCLAVRFALWLWLCCLEIPHVLQYACRSNGIQSELLLLVNTCIIGRARFTFPFLVSHIDTLLDDLFPGLLVGRVLARPIDQA